MKPNTIKKVLSVCLAALLPATLFSAGGSAHVAADVDGDGAVSAADARLCLRCAVELENYPAGSPAFIACDIDGDGEISSGDARLILRAAVGLNIDEGLSGRTVLSVPATVYHGKRGTVTLTEYKAFSSGPLATGPYLLCRLKVTDTSGMRYTLSAEDVQVNGNRLPNDGKKIELPPNSSVDLNIVIPAPYLAFPASGDPPVDELLASISFDSKAENRVFHARIALYPTGKTAGTVEHAAAAPKAVSHDAKEFLLGSNGAYYKTETGADGSLLLSDAAALIYFENRSDQDLSVVFTSITLNDGAQDHTFKTNQKLFVFANETAEPVLYISPDFLAANRISSLRSLSYTVEVHYAESGRLFYQKTNKIEQIIKTAE